MSTETITRIAIIGSRNYPLPEQVRNFVKELSQHNDELTIVSGGARGVDSIAVEAAEAAGAKTKVWPADWEKHGRKAGILRNYDIVNDAQRVVAFWDLQSRGTMHSMRIAKERGKLWRIFGPDGEELQVEEIELMLDG